MLRRRGRWLAACIVTLLATQAAPNELEAAECRQGDSIPCTCPEGTRTPAALDTRATEDIMICFGPRTPSSFMDAFDADIVTPVGPTRQMISHPGGIRVLRGVGADKSLTNWAEFTERVEGYGGQVEPDHTYRLQGPLPTPNDPKFEYQWSLAGWHAAEGASCEASNEWCKPRCNPEASLNPSVLWDLVKTDPPMKDIVLGVIDSIPARDCDLDQNIWTNPTPTEPNDPYPDDVHGYNAIVYEGGWGSGITGKDLDKAKRDANHGLAVASIMAAVGNNERKLAGVTWNAKLILCQVGRRVSEYAACLHYFAVMRQKGINIVAVNISGGGNSCSCCVERLIRRLRDLGVLVVAAAGNAGCANGPSEPIPVPCTNNSPEVTCERPFYPASNAVSNVIAVGASTCSGAPEKCSNYGRRSVHLFAPGYRIRTLSYPAFKYTSAAAPHVTGMIGLLAATPPGINLDWRGLRNLILAGGRPSASLLTNAAAVVQERALQTITDRNLLAWDDRAGGQALGSASCKGQTVKRRLLPLDNTKTIRRSQPLLLRAMAITCESSDQGVPVQVQKLSSDGTWTDLDPITLNDNGEAPDECAGDGEHAREWTEVEGEYRLRFWLGAEPEEEDLTVNVTP